MKKIIGVALILVVVLFALPFVVRQAQDTGQDPQPTAQEEAALPDSGHTLRVKGSDGQVTEMDLNQYLWGVVAAEMPASFSQEALKAQAVAARTYALNKGPSFNHPDADLCTDYACCQAWIARDKAQGNWGDKAAEYTNKITTAVAETGNQVILYQGQLIDAVFHSSSSAATQDAVEVWGNSVPYLQSVDSPEGEGVPNYESQVTLTTQEFKDAFLKAQPTASLEGDPASWVGTIERTQSGSVHASYWRRLERGEITKAQLLPGRFQEFFQREGIACTDYDQVNAAYQCHLGDTVVFLDQSYDLVRDLRGRVKQYAVTNGTRTAQERKLARSGLGDLFDGVFISEVVGAEKPSLDLSLIHI